jgi:hypothetical protein
MEMLPVKKTVYAVGAAAIVAWGAHRACAPRPSPVVAAAQPTNEAPSPAAPLVPFPSAERGLSEATQTQSGDVPPEVQSIARREERRPSTEPADPERKRVELERTGRVLAESVPWLEQRKLEAERAGHEKEARTLALRLERLGARLKMVERGVDPDEPVRAQRAAPSL